MDTDYFISCFLSMRTQKYHSNKIKPLLFQKKKKKGCVGRVSIQSLPFCLGVLVKSSEMKLMYLTDLDKIVHEVI